MGRLGGGQGLVGGPAGGREYPGPGSGRDEPRDRPGDLGAPVRPSADALGGHRRLLHHRLDPPGVTALSGPQRPSPGPGLGQSALRRHPAQGPIVVDSPTAWAVHTGWAILWIVANCTAAVALLAAALASLDACPGRMRPGTARGVRSREGPDRVGGPSCLRQPAV